MLSNPEIGHSPAQQYSLLGLARERIARHLANRGIAGAAWDKLELAEAFGQWQDEPSVQTVVMKNGEQLRIGFLLEPEESKHSSVRSIEVRPRSQRTEDTAEAADALVITRRDFRFIARCVRRLEKGRRRSWPGLSEDLLFIKINSTPD